MNELSLFTGIGGGVLGGMLLGWESIGYVEWDENCQRILAARIRDGLLHDAPIFGDIDAFNREGYAAAYTGLVDVLSAGFPCQPFSLAGKRLGADDPRNKWPATAESIRIVQPRHVFLENTPGIKDYLPVVFNDLRTLGYCVRPIVRAAAASLGAGHIRRRIWIRADLLGHSPQTRRPQPEPRSTVRKQHRLTPPRPPNRNFRRLPTWETEPPMDRVVHGPPDRLDRVGACGNSQIPAVAALAWLTLEEL